jgi:hypothetical protein
VLIVSTEVNVPHPEFPYGRTLLRLNTARGRVTESRAPPCAFAIDTPRSSRSARNRLWFRTARTRRTINAMMHITLTPIPVAIAAMAVVLSGALAAAGGVALLILVSSCISVRLALMVGARARSYQDQMGCRKRFTYLESRCALVWRRINSCVQYVLLFLSLESQILGNDCEMTKRRDDMRSERTDLTCRALACTHTFYRTEVLFPSSR